MQLTRRQQLGDFSSLVCFKAAIAGMEEALGEKATAIALTAAGRKRGKSLVQTLGLSHTSLPNEEIVTQLQKALGIEGTRLCIVEKIETEGDKYKVYVSEALCSAGEPDGSDRKCLFTLGAVWGAMEEILNKKFRGVHTESVLKGSPYDIFELTPM
ncbi:hydrocarbon-binding protein [Oscillatoria sp. FACHB-1406]|uniref:hydrocarbon-binding protein n=1 Tax=Oscillatoria sp. FACHB-1406 TaxID=2692846 RepID=UPI001683EA67|nr:hydrocarbon-binding protein [Oscillatoria sp. FACHB-1406]MBD2576455.1 hydrocarbon-binding protein [Oscillatoria sp. FACHB-1406]